MHLKRETLQIIRFGIMKNYLIFVNFTKNLISFYKSISMRSSEYITGSMKILHFSKTRLNFLKKSFFSSTIIEWNNRHQNIRNSSCFNTFRKLMTIIRQFANNFFRIHDRKVIKFITRLQLGLV